MKRFLTILTLSAVLFVSLAACTPQNNKELSGAEKDQAMAYIDPIADNLLTGFNNGDYPTFSRDFNDKMLSSLNQQQFETTRKQINDKVGSYQSRSLDKVIDYDTMLTVVYKSVFSKGTNLQILLTVTKDEPHKVTGLYFR